MSPKASHDWWSKREIDWGREQPRKIRDVLSHAYPERAAVEKLLDGLGVPSIGAPGDDARPRDLWTWAIAAVVEAGMVFQLRQAVLGDRQKSAFHRPLSKWFPWDDAPCDEGLQAINVATLGFTDANMAMRVIRDAIRRTAMIQIGGVAAGTAFLVGPDLLLTAAHVLDAEVAPQDLEGVTATFDFLAHEGRAPNETGDEVAVTGPCLAWSPPTKKEIAGQTHAGEADLNHLDYALIRLERLAAADVVQGERRGHYALSDVEYKFVPESLFKIPQHPLGQTQLHCDALDPTINNSGARVRYRSNTLPGSSGSAVLDRNGRVVALHHYSTSGWNQGVPIHAIVRDIAQQDVVLPGPDPASWKTTTTTAAPATAPDPFKTTHVGPKPFLNRNELRQKLKSLLSRRDQNILLLEGAAEAGKSFSFHYLAHLEAERAHPVLIGLAEDGFRAVNIDLDPFTHLSGDETREAVIGQICGAMKLSPPESRAQAARHIVEFVTLLDTELQRKGSKVIWCLFFDSLDRHVLAHGQIDELITELCHLIDRKPGLPLRLILSSRERPTLPQSVIDWVDREPVRAPDRQDMRDWLAQCASKQIKTDTVRSKFEKRFPPDEPLPRTADITKGMADLLKELQKGVAP